MRARRHIVTGLQLMLTPEALVPFLFGAIALGILGNAAYDLLLGAVGDAMGSVGMIGAGAISVMVGSAWAFSKAVNRRAAAPPLPGKRAPSPHKGLIVLVSNAASLAKAIEHHRAALQYCWLVCSGRSAPVAQGSYEELEKQGKHAHLVAVDDVYDPVEVRDKVNEIYRRLPEGCAESDVILDFTGMTAVASVGSVLACLNAARPIQYTPPEFDKDMKPVGVKEPIEITLDYGTLGVEEPVHRAVASGSDT